MARALPPSGGGQSMGRVGGGQSNVVVRNGEDS